MCVNKHGDTQYLSTTTHLNKAITMAEDEEECLLILRNGGAVVREGQTFKLAGSAEKTGNSQKEFRDRAYHKMILDLINPYCSEEAKIFYSFFARQVNGRITVSADSYKCLRIWLLLKMGG